MIFDRLLNMKEKLDNKAYPDDILLDIKGLNRKKKKALKRLLKYEAGDKKGYTLRSRFYNDLYQFDNSLNLLASKILSIKHPKLAFKTGSSIFGNFSEVNAEIDELKKRGYITSQYKLEEHTLSSIKNALESCTYTTRGQNPITLTGGELQRISDLKDYELLQNNTTFWLTDQNMALQNRVLASLAFDPYILSVVSGYLGCEPIHVQTNAWFSFQSNSNTKELSTNAQLYHQDKDFIKFIKVFIYLNDVTENNGPHCYVEGSHIDELFKYGIPLSQRLTDSEVIKYYSPDRIKEALGAEGTIIFGDTCAVHKGQPVKEGSRLLLQLEYASSLHLSPIPPFEDLSSDIKNLLNERNIPLRVTENYNSESKRGYEDYIKNNILKGLNRFYRIFL